MKKVGSLILRSLCLICILFSTGCAKKEAISMETFIETMESKGYSLYDVTEQFADTYVSKAYIAIDKNEEYQIEFYIIDNESDAKYFFDYNKTLFEEEKEGKYSETSVNLTNHNKYTLQSGSKYKTLSRIDNTVLYLNVNNAYKTTVQDLVKELGY